MNFNDFKCETIIKELQQQLHLQHIDVFFDNKQVLKEIYARGAHLVYFIVMNDVIEREKFEKKYNKEVYKTKSPAIHFPDLTVDELLDWFQMDVTGAYERTCEYLETIRMKSECPVEMKYVIHIFLHEVGHWMQLQKNG